MKRFAFAATSRLSGPGWRAVCQLLIHWSFVLGVAAFIDQFAIFSGFFRELIIVAAPFATTMSTSGGDGAASSSVPSVGYIALPTGPRSHVTT